MAVSSPPEVREGPGVGWRLPPGVSAAR